MAQLQIASVHAPYSSFRWHRFQGSLCGSCFFGTATTRKPFANLCTEDGDVVNVVGWWWNGRSQIEKKVSDAHAFIFRESTLTHNEVHILTPQIAVVHVRWSMVGHKSPDGTPGQPRRGIDTQVLQKQAGKWLIAAFHNTDSVPEVPFPTGQPAAQPGKGARL